MTSNTDELDLEVMAIFGANQLEQRAKRFKDLKKNLQAQAVQSLITSQKQALLDELLGSTKVYGVWLSQDSGQGRAIKAQAVPVEVIQALKEGLK